MSQNGQPETWREAIERACAAVPAAEAERQRVLKLANRAGLSTRELAKIMGVSGSTVWRWMGGESASRSPDGLLDAPAEL